MLPDNFHVVVTEQSADGRQFNRGAVINIACDLFKDKAIHMMTHDVDVYPKKTTIDEHYTKDVVADQVFGIYTSSCNTLGGIIKMKLDTFQTINGFPNHYWGWGVEDKALQNRVEIFNLKIYKLITDKNPKKTDYFTIFDDINDRVTTADFSSRTQFDYHVFKTLPYDKKIEICMSSGLNTLKYKVLERKEIHPKVTHVISRIE
jgi:hypothetical protein